MLFKASGILPSQKIYSEKRGSSSDWKQIETTMNIQRLIREARFEEVRAALAENKNIDLKIAEETLISLFKTKEKQLPRELIELILHRFVKENTFLFPNDKITFVLIDSIQTSTGLTAKVGSSVLQLISSF